MGIAEVYVRAMTQHNSTNVSRLPDAVALLANRLGCETDSKIRAVELRQTGQMRQNKASKWMSFKAHQTIDVRRCAFEWNARTGPFNLVHVRDTFDDQHGTLSVALLGVIPIARAPRSPEIDRGELMRYLAELAWAPDAILANADLDWHVEDENHLVVKTCYQSRQVELKIKLDQDGLVVEVFANDRPRAVKGGFESGAWRGVFSKYERRVGRNIPTCAEVGWITNDEYEPVWRGELTAWRVVS